MNRKNLSFILLLIIGIPLCLSFTNQDDFVANVQKKLTHYYQEASPLKISLSFNQSVYAPGDTAYFKVGLLIANSLRPVAGSSIIHINLVDSIGQIIHHQKIRIMDGKGFNQIAISKTLKSGFYTIVAYNDWMKNSDESLFTHYQIKIAGDRKLRELTPAYDLNLFPEGGQVVEEVNNKIVFTGPPNSTVDISENSTVISKVKLNEEGLGTIFLTPKKAAAYSASVVTKRKDIHIQSDGIGVLATISQADTSIKCILQVPRNSILRNETYRLLLSSHDNIYSAAEVSFKNRTHATITIPRQGIPETLLLITIFNKNESVVAQRMLQIPPKSKLKSNVIQTNGEYDSREKVIVGLDIPSARNSIVSMCVINTDFFEQAEIESDFKESVETFLDLPFSGLGIPEKLRQNIGSVNWNDFLVTQTWKRFSWEDVLNEKIRKDYSFNRLLVFNGKAYREDKQPFKKSTHINFFLQSTIISYEAVVDENGNFSIPLLLDFYDTEEVYYTVNDPDSPEEKPDVHIEITGENVNKFYKSGAYQYFQSDNFTEFWKSKIALDAAFSVSSDTILIPRSDRMILFEKAHFTPDVTILLKDYLLFPDMKETLREIVPNMSHRVKDGRDIVRLHLKDNSSNPPTVQAAVQDPLYIIDGILTDDTDYFLSLPPKDVASIKLILDRKTLSRLNAIGENGIVMVETKIPNNHLNVVRSKNTINVNGLTKPKPFKSFVTENSNTRIPKMATTLYFNPEIVTDSNGKASATFYTPDNTGNFRIFIQGFDITGKPFNAERDFSVKFKPSLN